MKNIYVFQERVGGAREDVIVAFPKAKWRRKQENSSLYCVFIRHRLCQELESAVRLHFCGRQVYPPPLDQEPGFLPKAKDLSAARVFQLTLHFSYLRKSFLSKQALCGSAT